MSIYEILIEGFKYQLGLVMFNPGLAIILALFVAVYLVFTSKGF